VKIFVSGATGFIGNRLAIRLAEQGHSVHALYRDDNKLPLLNHNGIEPFKGDILDKPSLEKAITGCELVYHTAAFASVWTSDPSIIYRLNIEGTTNVVNCARTSGIRKIVCTSTAGVYGPSGVNGMNDENTPKPGKYFIDYEASKSILEVVLHTLSHSGTEIVIVNPTRVYGPGILSESNGVTRMVEAYMSGNWHFIPGNGKSTGNYVHVNDVVTGHILAMEKGLNGDNYILGGTNVSYDDFFRELSRLSGQRRWLVHIPAPVMMLIAGLMLFNTKITGRAPVVTPPLVRRFVNYWNVSSSKAVKELGYKPMSLEAGLTNTIDWINRKKIISNEQ
jgi:NAD+-dependent farnesol dehydrogenase